MGNVTRLDPPQHRSEAAVAVFMALLFPGMTRLLRELAASATGYPLARPDAAGSRSACVPDSATPGTVTPGVAVPRNLLEKQDMHSLPHSGDVAVVPTPDLSAARHTALLRWHSRRVLADVVADLDQNPHFPVIAAPQSLEGAA